MSLSRFSRSVFRWLAPALAVLGTSRAAADHPLTLPQALAFAGERHPALAAQAFRDQAAEGLIEQAGQRPNPTLEVGVENVLGTGAASGVRSLEATVQAAQTFERGDKRGKRIALADRDRAATAQEFAVRRAEILAATAAAYVSALAAQERLALAAEPLRLARETLAVLEARARAGAASQIETLRARAAVVAAESDVARATAAFAAARTALAAAWGGSPAAPAALAGTLRTPDVLPSDAGWRARLASHPRLALQQAVIAGRRAALDLEQAQAAPDVTASGGLRFLRDGSDAAFVAGVSVPLPVRHKNQGNIRAARATLAGAEHAVGTIAAELEAAFAVAWQDLAAAHALAQNLRRDVLPATAEAVAAVRRAHEAGAVPLTDVLEAQRALAALRRDVLAAEADYAAAQVRLDALADPAFSATAALLATP